MTFLQRIRNIWKLGEIELFPNGHYQTVNPITGKPVIPDRKMAQIIRKKTDKEIINDLLEDK